VVGGGLVARQICRCRIDRSYFGSYHSTSHIAIFDGKRRLRKREVVSIDNFASIFFAFDKFVTSCNAA